MPHPPLNTRRESVGPRAPRPFPPVLHRAWGGGRWGPLLALGLAFGSGAFPGRAPAAGPPPEPPPAACPATAGALQGAFLQSGATVVPLCRALALLHDNAEGFETGASDLRLLLTDRPVDPLLLQDLTPAFPLSEAARSGALRGVLLSLDPSAPGSLTLVPLLPGEGMHTITLFRSPEPPLRPFEPGSGRWRTSFTYDSGASGSGSAEAADQADRLKLAFRLDVPVALMPPVTARRMGAAALATPQGQLALAMAAAMAAGKGSGPAQLEAPPPELLPLLREEGTRLGRALARDDLLLVERGDRSTLVYREADCCRGAIPFRRVGGRWQLQRP